MQHLAAGELVNLALWNASDVVIRRISGLIHSPNRNTSNNMKKKKEKRKKGAVHNINEA